MNVCIKCGQLQQALSVYRTMLAEGCEPNVRSREGSCIVSAGP